MTYGDTHPEDSEFRKEELKTVKSRRRLYTGTFVIVLCALLYLLGQVLNILATPVAIVVWTTIIVFCLRGPVNYLESKGLGRLWGTCIAYVLMAAVVTVLGWILCLASSSRRCSKPLPIKCLRCATSGTMCIPSTPTSCKMSASPIG